MSLNAYKADYVRRRLSNIKTKRLMVLVEKHRTPPTHLTAAEFLILAQDGELGVRPDRGGEKIEGRRVAELFDVEPFSEPEHWVDKGSYERKRQEIEDDAVRVQDMIVLGDEEEALKLLQEFARER